MAFCYWAHRLQKLQPKVENPGGSALRGLRECLCCNTIAGADFVKGSCWKSCILLMKLTFVL